MQGDLAALEQLSVELRKNQWDVRLALKDGRLIGTFARAAPLLGLAVDLGSTKLAVYLVNLETGATLAQTGVMNPQIAYGEDVVNRIAFANRGEGNRRMLQERVIEALNGAAAELCARAHTSTGQIVDAAVVGNTAMHHFFTHLPVAQLGSAPYVAAVNQPLEVRAAELGLNFAPGAQVYLPANIAGYVGGDHTAALLATRSFPGPRRVLVDIGTNTEISLVSGGEIYSCSTASGPAFEGAHIHDGMRAAPGAIERVRLRDGRAQVWTIGGLPPVGVCGSGILQAVAEMLAAGVIDQRGTLRKGAEGVRLTEGKSEFLLVAAAQTGHGRDVVVTRRDVNEIQLAKGAIRAGIEIMLQKGGITAAEVDEWVIAGAFGTYLDLASAVRVGMFPDVPLERFHQVGNAAGMGAKQMLLSLSERAEATRLAGRAHYVELTVEPGFTDEFMKALYF
ncbi:MAG TPA: ASKHA domain-containing protein [Polyangia bacterium]